MREPFLSETPAAFRKIPNRSGGAGRKGVEGEGNSRPALASHLLVAEILANFCFLFLALDFFFVLRPESKVQVQHERRFSRNVLLCRTRTSQRANVKNSAAGLLSEKPCGVSPSVSAAIREP